MNRRRPTDGGATDHPAEQADPVVCIRYRQPQDYEWEEACLQFQGGKSLLAKVWLDLEKQGHHCQKSADCLYTKAEKPSIDKALRRAGFDPAQVVDVTAPMPVSKTDDGA